MATDRDRRALYDGLTILEALGRLEAAALDYPIAAKPPELQKALALVTDDERAQDALDGLATLVVTLVRDVWPELPPGEAIEGFVFRMRSALVDGTTDRSG